MASQDGASSTPEMISRRDLLDSSGIGEEQLAELEAHGLVRRVGRLHSQAALDIASTVAMLASYGVQARHLRTARTAAERDVSLIEQVVAPTLRQRSPQARSDAARTASQIAALLIRLHSAMIEADLAEAGLRVTGLAAGGAGTARDSPLFPSRSQDANARPAEPPSAFPNAPS